jgi:hypothetical protein
MIPIDERRPRFWARLVGLFYLLSLATAIAGEAFLHGTVAYAAGLVAVSCYLAVTLFLYALFAPVSRSLALLGTGFNLVNLTFEALRANPPGLNVALVFYGLHCLTIGSLMFKSSFLPRLLGALMAIGGLAWLTQAFPAFANRLAPYGPAVGFLGVGVPMLWLLVVGVDAGRWRKQAGAMGGSVA